MNCDARSSAEGREAAARSVSLTAGARGARARHPRRGAGEGRGCDQWPIAERAGSRSSSQSRLLACPFAAGGTDHRACEHALPVRLWRHDEDRRERQQAPRSRRNGACWSRACRNTSVAAVRGPSCRRTHRSTSCPADCRPKRPSRVILSNLATIRHFTVRPRSMPARGSGLIGPRWATGLASCFHLQPIADHMRHHLAMADRLFMDETKAPVLDPGRGQTKKGYFWAIASDDRGHSGPSPPIVLFRFAPGRSGAFPQQFLDSFGGRYLVERSCSTTRAWDARALLEPFAPALRQIGGQQQVTDRRGRCSAHLAALHHRSHGARLIPGHPASRAQGSLNRVAAKRLRLAPVRDNWLVKVRAR